MSEKEENSFSSFEIVQYEKNRTTGEDLNFNENVILAGLAKREEGSRIGLISSMTKTFTSRGTIYQKRQFVGDKRPRHWHVLLEFNSQAELDSVAKAFGVAENFVEKKSVQVLSSTVFII